jgi:hypothetical protein
MRSRPDRLAIGRPEIDDSIEDEERRRRRELAPVTNWQIP